MTIIRRKIIAAVLSLLVVSFASTVSAQRLNKLIELMENDQPAFGVLSFDYSLNNARSMATSGLDFVFIDMEHAPVSYTHLTLPTILLV